MASYPNGTFFGGEFYPARIIGGLTHLDVPSLKHRLCHTLRCPTENASTQHLNIPLFAERQPECNTKTYGTQALHLWGDMGGTMLIISSARLHAKIDRAKHVIYISNPSGMQGVYIHIFLQAQRK